VPAIATVDRNARLVIMAVLLIVGYLYFPMLS